MKIVQHIDAAELTEMLTLLYASRGWGKVKGVRFVVTPDTDAHDRATGTHTVSAEVEVEGAE